MAETPGDAKLGAAGTHLMEFSQKMQQQDTRKRRDPAKVIQLPLWPEAKRGAPNAVLRGALFPAIQGKNRIGLLRKELIATQDGVRIRYTGRSSTKPTWTCGNTPSTWPGRRPSARSVISPPTAF